MGVNWVAGLMRWKPHVRRNGEACSLSHVHPFRYELRFAEAACHLARVVTVHVGFSCHVFTCRLEHAGPNPELYSDDRETRAFSVERYERSHLLRDIVVGLEHRKCYFAGREHFITLELNGTPPGYEYRVFFAVRRKDAHTIELIVQSAYLARVEERRHSQTGKPIGFRLIVSKILLKHPLVEAR